MAGLFGFFDYTRPGKGVSRDEPQKPRFLLFWELFFRKFWKLVQLNLLYIAFCLPIVTIGPATAGFTYVLRNMVNEKPVFLFSDFWDGFKSNFLQSIMYSVLAVVCSVLLWVALRFYMLNSAAVSWMYAPLALCMMMALLFVFMSFYVFLMIVTLDLPLRLILKNAAILSVVCLKTNFLTLLFVGLILFLSFIIPPLGAMIFIFITPALIGFIICFNSYQGIKKYAVDPYLESQKRDASEDPNDMIFQDESGADSK